MDAYDVTTYILRMSNSNLKNPFIAPHMQHGALPPPDYTRLPPNLREAVQRVDPVRVDEACGHLLTSTQPISVPTARYRVIAVTEDGGQPCPPRVGLYAVDADGKARITQSYFAPDQARILRDAIDAALAELEVRAQSPETVPPVTTES